MIKMVSLLKRNPAMSREDFEAYYEGHHAKLAERVLDGQGVSYRRRYLHPLPHPLAAPTGDAGHDVLMEMWFADQDSMNRAMALFAAPEHADVLAKDEAHLFDTMRTQIYLVTDERESAC